MSRCPSCHRRIAAGSCCGRDTWRAPDEAEGAAFEGGPIPTLASCVVGRRIGRGGFAEVWEATRLPARGRAALKVGLSDHALLVARFGREAEALIRVGPPHAPRLHEHGTLADGRPYLLMDLVPGETLASWLEAHERPPEAARARRVAIAIVRAVEGVHGRGLVHRDLKPENVFVDEAAGSAVLVDFGLARGGAVDGAGALAPITRPGTAAGTLEYVAPEQLRGDPAQDARADVYSLGVMLYEILTLRPPFAGDAAEVEYGHIALRPRRPGEITPVPEALERVVLECLAKDPARRPGSVTALRCALEEAGDAERGGASGGAMASGEGGMIGDGRRPVVVLLVETAAPASTVLGAVAGRRGRMARQRGRRYVALFAASEMEAPIDAALEVAHELCAGGARAAVHLAQVTIRARPDGAPAVYGAAVDRPETWLAACVPGERGAHTSAGGTLAGAARDGAARDGAIEWSGAARDGAARDGAIEWSGVIMTAEIERAVAAAGRAAPGEAAIVGRDEAIATLDESAAAAIAGRPALVTLIGDHGLGKSRLAAEAVVRFRRAAATAAATATATVITVRATQPAAGGGERTAIELLGRLRASAEVPSHRVDRARALAAAIEDAAREAPLAIVLDDAHWADDATLDALELSTLQGPSALWVVVAAHPRFEDARRGWGGRAERHDRVVLGPLGEAAGKELAAALLAPAEYPPADALAALHAWADGNPACLAEIADALKDAGLVRRRGSSGGHYLATSEIRSLRASPARQWLAARSLDAMPQELAACARLCAVLGAGLSRDEVEAVQDALERAGAPSTPIDAGVGLRALCERGVLAAIGGERFSFRSAVTEDAVRAMLDGAHRDRIHRAALSLWRARVAAAPGEADTFALERLARHAAAAGERAEAARVLLTLGDRERAQHRHVAADARCSAALEQLGEGDASARARALACRGKVRYRLYRTNESLADFDAAGALARSIGDDTLLADVLLEQATALDWESDFAGSQARVEEARPRIEALGDPGLALRLLVAEGRSAWRHGRVAEAAELLDRGAAEAEAAGDYDARVVALSLLSCALVVAGRLDEAEARCDEVIALAAEARDAVHLSVAYTNRFFLWSQRKDLVRAATDMRRAMELAREAGNPWPERAATTNLAELSFWCGRDGESLELARRGRSLEERFSARPVHESALVLARVHAARGDHAEAAALAAWIEERCPPGASAPSAHALLGAVRLLVSGGAPEAWEALAAQADALIPVERLELLHLRARAAAESGRREELARVVAEAEPLFDEGPDFRRRFAELAEVIAGAGELPPPGVTASTCRGSAARRG